VKEKKFGAEISNHLAITLMKQKPLKFFYPKFIQIEFLLAEAQST